MFFKRPLKKKIGHEVPIPKTTHKRNSNVKIGHNGPWGLSNHLNIAKDRISKQNDGPQKLPRM